MRARPLFIISIHALREEGDMPKTHCIQYFAIFLSTPSARRATGQPVKPRSSTTNFYPRPPRGGRRRTSSGKSWKKLFLSTPSARRATNQWSVCLDFFCISIHALREEGDLCRRHNGGCGGEFLSTPSARRATAPWKNNLRIGTISIHALREEGDDPHKRIRSACKISIHALREEGDVDV